PGLALVIRSCATARGPVAARSTSAALRSAAARSLVPLAAAVAGVAGLEIAAADRGDDGASGCGFPGADRPAGARIRRRRAAQGAGTSGACGTAASVRAAPPEGDGPVRTSDSPARNA